MALECPVCGHEHDEDGTCACGCTAEEDLEQLCWNCGHPEHEGHTCRCGCEG